MLKKFFNWCAEKPSSQYTLADVAGQQKYAFKFNRAARFTERFTTIPMLVGGGIIALAGAPAGLAGGAVAAAGVATVGLLIMAFAKVQGLVHGGIVHLGAKGLSSLANHLSEDRKPAPVAERIEPTL